MQNTRLNTLVETSLGRFDQWLQNPWRRVSLVILSLLLGNFLATAIATSSGQAAEWDILAGLLLVGFTEFVSWFVYRRNRNRDNTTPSSTLAETMNGLKIGLTYGMFIEAFKLGS